jgi:hypothetical protein
LDWIQNATVIQAATHEPVHGLFQIPDATVKLQGALECVK